MSAKPTVWMPLYVADYLGDTMHLTTEEHGAYLLLIMHYWRSGPLPDDAATLAAITRLPRRSWSKMSNKICAYFLKKNGRLVHTRIERELGSASSHIEQRRSAGKASAEARSRQRALNEIANENPTGVATSVSTGGPTKALREGRPSPSPSESKKDSPPTPSSREVPPLSLVSDEATNEEGEFEAFWRAYPRKDDKGSARKAFRTARKKAPAQIILDGIARYAWSPERRFQKLAATWLNAEAWANEPAAAPTAAPNGHVDPARPLDEDGMPSNPPCQPHPDLDTPSIGDMWGAWSWSSRLPDMQPITVMSGKRRPGINGWDVLELVALLCDAAGIDDRDRPNLDALAQWCREDLPCTTTAALEQIKERAKWMRDQRRPVVDLKAFDAIVRAATRRLQRRALDGQVELAWRPPVGQS